MKDRRHPQKIVAFVMAGGEGKRLRPLTMTRCKPAVPFGGRYRIIDFVLSNLLNSGIGCIYLLVQYKAQSLIDHVRQGWTVSHLLSDQFVTIVPPQMRRGKEWYQGTADAVYQSLNLLHLHRPDKVAVFGADHIYRMDVRQMLRLHQQRDAEISVAALQIPIGQTMDFGIIDADEDGRIRGFEEKPVHGKAIPANPDCAYASMGNYLFNTDVLLVALEQAHQQGETDFGHDILPRLLHTHRLYIYDFSTNQIPGIKSYEEQGYWRDVGTLDAYFDAQRDVLGVQPRFDVFNPQWPIFSSHYQGPVARVINSKVDNCLLGAAVVINNAHIRNTIIRRSGHRT